MHRRNKRKPSSRDGDIVNTQTSQLLAADNSCAHNSPQHNFLHEGILHSLVAQVGPGHAWSASLSFMVGPPAGPVLVPLRHCLVMDTLHVGYDRRGHWLETCPAAYLYLWQHRKRILLGFNKIMSSTCTYLNWRTRLGSLQS